MEILQSLLYYYRMQFCEKKCKNFIDIEGNFLNELYKMVLEIILHGFIFIFHK